MLLDLARAEVGGNDCEKHMVVSVEDGVHHRLECCAVSFDELMVDADVVDDQAVAVDSGLEFFGVVDAELAKFDGGHVVEVAGAADIVGVLEHQCADRVSQSRFAVAFVAHHHQAKVVGGLERFCSFGNHAVALRVVVQKLATAFVHEVLHEVVQFVANLFFCVFVDVIKLLSSLEVLGCLRLVPVVKQFHVVS